MGKILQCHQDPTPLLLQAATSQPQLLLNSQEAAPMGTQHPREAHVDPHRPPSYSSAHPSCRDISPSLQRKAIAFSANIDSSLFSVNIYPHFNKKISLQPRSRPRRPCTKHIRSWPAFQQRRHFCCSWLQLRGEATARGSNWLPSPGKPASPTRQFFGRVGESHTLVGGEKPLDQSPQLRQPQALVMAPEQDVANPPQHWGFPSGL